MTRHLLLLLSLKERGRFVRIWPQWTEKPRSPGATLPNYPSSSTVVKQPPTRQQNIAVLPLTLQKSRMPQIQGVKGEAVVIYREPLTTQEMRHHRLSRRVNNMAGFSLFVHITHSEFHKIAQEDRKVRLLLLFRTFCHVVYATLGLPYTRGNYRGAGPTP